MPRVDSNNEFAALAENESTNSPQLLQIDNATGRLMITIAAESGVASAQTAEIDDNNSYIALFTDDSGNPIPALMDGNSLWMDVTFE